MCVIIIKESLNTEKYDIILAEHIEQILVANYSGRAD